MATEKRLICDEDAKRRIIALAVAHNTSSLPIDMVINVILHQTPTVEAVEVVHGRWKAHKPDCRGYTAGFICSCCGDIVYTDYRMKECEYNYCPNCGAKMDSEME